MSYTLEKLPDAPIIVVSHEQGSHVVQDLAALGDEMIHLLDAQPQPVYVIADLSNVSMDLGDHIQASEVSTRTDNAMMRHHNVVESIFVGRDPLVKAAARGLGSATFGFAKVVHFATLDEALDYCYEQLGRERPADAAEAGAR